MRNRGWDRFLLGPSRLHWTDILRFRDLRVLADSLREPFPDERASHSARNREAGLEARIRRLMEEEIDRLRRLAFFPDADGN